MAQAWPRLGIFNFESLGDIRKFSCGKGDVGRLCSSVVRAVDRQSKDLGSIPSAVERVFFFQRKILKFFKFVILFVPSLR